MSNELRDLIAVIDGTTAPTIEIVTPDKIASIPADLLRTIVHEYSPVRKIPVGRARANGTANLRSDAGDPNVIRLLQRGEIVHVADTPPRRAILNKVAYTWVCVTALEDNRAGWVAEELLTAIPGGEFSLQWPVAMPRITQRFGVNPQDYARFGLPGHEGIDFAANMGSPVMASAGGTVYETPTDLSKPYGNNVKIRHENGFRTIYAHLSEIGCQVGQVVKAGDVIGKAGSTGNSTAPHLHITLKLDGATRAKLTAYPEDQIDPLPYLPQ